MKRPDSPGLVHQALLYDTSDEFLAAVLPFVRDGVDNGDAILAITSKTDTALLRESLGPMADKVSFFEPASWYDAPGRALAACYRHLEERLAGHDFVRIIGQPVRTSLDPLEAVEWCRFEAVINVALATSPAWMMCGYDSRTVPAEIVAEARRTHPELTVGALHQPSDAFTDPAAYYVECNRDLPPPPENGVDWMRFDTDPAPVRRFVARHAAAMGLSPRRLDDLRLAVNEVTTNAIRHGGGSGEVRLWRSGRRIVCEIRDHGTARDTFLGHVPGDPSAEGGHGLWIARQLCDLLEIRTDQPGTKVRMHMRTEEQSA
ncbi:MAG TPA: sensor histidine kinase [Micromonosporaceae bacterium]|nr:sensor histidine kinase [Micromonosporaceae bacterium]